MSVLLSSYQQQQQYDIERYLNLYWVYKTKDWFRTQQQDVEIKNLKRENEIRKKMRDDSVQSLISYFYKR